MDINSVTIYFTGGFNRVRKRSAGCAKALFSRGNVMNILREYKSRTGAEWGEMQILHSHIVTLPQNIYPKESGFLQNKVANSIHNVLALNELKY